MADGHIERVPFSKFLRTKEQEAYSDTPDEYCDILIGLHSVSVLHTYTYPWTAHCKGYSLSPEKAPKGQKMNRK